jgi:hypothetical protein
MTDSKDLTAIFKQAAEIAEQMPEVLRPAAFQRALDALLGPQAVPVAPAATPVSQKSAPSPRVVKQPLSEREGHSAAVTKLLEVLDRTELSALLRGRKVLDRALLLLRAAQRHDLDALTAADIAHVLAKKFREPASTNAVGMALNRSPAYTDRRPQGGTYLYALMAPGEQYLESLSDAVNAAPAVIPSKAHRRAVRKPAPTKRKAPASDEPTTARARRATPAGRPGPKVALEGLIQEGFFSKPRVMADILTHLQVDKTYSYKTSDMTATLQRLVRQGRLRRSRNAEEQFQYAAK